MDEVFHDKEVTISQYDLCAYIGKERAETIIKSAAAFLHSETVYQGTKDESRKRIEIPFKSDKNANKKRQDYGDPAALNTFAKNV